MQLDLHTPTEVGNVERFFHSLTVERILQKYRVYYIMINTSIENMRPFPHMLKAMSEGFSLCKKVMAERNISEPVIDITQHDKDILKERERQKAFRKK